jgi:hypothetical protein
MNGLTGPEGIRLHECESYNPRNQVNMMSLTEVDNQASAAEQTRAAEAIQPSDEAWPDPSGLEVSRVSVVPFRERMLPESLRPFVLEIARHKQVPIDMPAIALLAAISAAAGRRIKVQPKQLDTGWTKTPNLWCVIVAGAGSLKTPVVNACLKPLIEIQEELQRDARTKVQQMEDLQSAEDGSIDENEIQALFHGTRLIVNDATPEVLHELLAKNPQGLLLVRDELAGLLEIQGKKGREGERQFFLEAWNGDSPYTIDRIGRGTVTATPCLSVYGGIQPDKLASIQRKWFCDDSGNDGFLERFQLFVWPDFAPDWTYIDEIPDKEAGNTVKQILSRIVRIDPKAPLVVRFAKDAQEIFIGWLSNLELRLRNDAMHPILRSHLSKFRSLMPSLACLFALADRAATAPGLEGDKSCLEIAPRYAELAVEWCVYLESHAMRIYQPVISPGIQPAEFLVAQISKGSLRPGESFTVRDIKQKGWAGLKNDFDIESGLAVLAQKYWLKTLPLETSVKGGRPTTRYEINPKVRARFSSAN